MIDEKGEVNNSLFGISFPTSDKGSKYLSPKLNEIGKFEQKLTDSSGKGSNEEWPQRDVETSGCLKLRSSKHNLLLVLLVFIVPVKMLFISR